MLSNDEFFWKTNATRNAPKVCWSGSGGDQEKLWRHSQRRWTAIQRELAAVGVPSPTGKVLEFGAGMGFQDELLDDRTTSLVLLDHTDAFVRERTHPFKPRCRHLLWTPDALAQLQPEAGSFDWLLFLGVFYHLEDASAVALIEELGRLLRPGGHVLVYGFNTATPEKLREMGTRERLFARYPNYVMSPDLLRDALAPDYREISRREMLLYEFTVRTRQACP